MGELTLESDRDIREQGQITLFADDPTVYLSERDSFDTLQRILDE